MRAREFLMKDAYSFHIDENSLADTYRLMRSTYERISDRLQLEYRIVQAGSGEIGGSRSEEFQVLAGSGEDVLAYCDGEDFAGNVEVVDLPKPRDSRRAPSEKRELVATPKAGTIDELSRFLGIGAERCLKILLVKGKDAPAVGLLLRGDHELNALKAQKLADVMTPLTMLRPAEVEAATHSPPGFVGPIGLDIPLYVDQSAAVLADFVCGANQRDHHWRGVNWERDLPLPTVADLRNATAGDPSPGGTGVLSIARGIEVGHIFQLGTKYSESMQATVLDSEGQARFMQMGCYGIGVTRVVAAAIEQNHDDKGIIWPEAIAPFNVILVPLNQEKSEQVATTTRALYEELTKAGLEVLVDDRNQRAGAKFADADLIGIPHRIVVAERGLAAGRVEYKARRDAEPTLIALDGVVRELEARRAR
jgi:prolyl-tRNA synthetase